MNALDVEFPQSLEPLRPPAWWQRFATRMQRLRDQPWGAFGSFGATVPRRFGLLAGTPATHQKYLLAWLVLLHTASEHWPDHVTSYDRPFGEDDELFLDALNYSKRLGLDQPGNGATKLTRDGLVVLRRLSRRFPDARRHCENNLRHHPRLARL